MKQDCKGILLTLSRKNKLIFGGGPSKLLKIEGEKKKKKDFPHEVPGAVLICSSKDITSGRGPANELPSD